MNNKIKLVIEKYKYYAIAILLGILLMLISFPTNETTEIVLTHQEIDVKTELEDVLSDIYGVGRVSVMLTTFTSTTYEFLQDESITQNDGKLERDIETILISKQGGGEEPIKTRDIYPLYKGALIVCDGGENPLIKLQIVNAVSSLLGISSDKITITKMKE